MLPTLARLPFRSLCDTWSALKISAAVVGIVLVSGVVPTSEARAQVVAKAKDDKPAPIDTRPLARYVPKDKLVFLIESEGLNAQPEAWKKTAAYRLFNETTLGEMLEAMLTQLSERMLTYSPTQKISGADVSLLVKHVASQGFVLAGVANDKGTPTVIVFRGGYAARDSRPAFGRLMGNMMGASKFSSIKRAGRTVAQVTPASGKSWYWWPEQGDLVIAENADAVIAVLDGKSPNAVDHPLRAALAKTEAGFSPLGIMFLDPAAAGDAKPDFVVRVEQALGGLGVTRLDYRWGFQDDALMTVGRLQAPKPRKGFLAVVDQPAFDRTKILPLPPTLESFSAFTLDANKALDVLLPAMPPLPPQADALTEGISSLETKSRVDIRKDLLGRMGPRMVAYVMPGSTPPRASTEAAPKAEPNPLSGMLGIPLPGMGTVAFPRYALLAELKDPEGIVKDLDKLMVALNKDLKARAVEADKEREAAGGAAGRPGGFGRGGFGRGALGEMGGPGGRRAGTPVIAPEFKLMPGKEKIYVLTMPSDQVKLLPVGFRPTIRLGGKYVAIAANPEIARMAIEAKEGGYSPPADVATSLDRLPAVLSYLSVRDPRGTTPELLSSLPATVQALANALIPLAPPPGPGATANASPSGAAPGGPPSGTAVGNSDDPRGGRRGRGESERGPATKGAPANMPPGMEGMMAAMGGGPPGAQAPKKPNATKVTPFYFDIDQGIRPSVDDIKSKLFPTVFAISSDDNEIVFQSRGAFPNPVSKEFLEGITLGIPLGSSMLPGGAPPTPPPGAPFAGQGGRPSGPGAPPAAGGAGGRRRRDEGGGGTTRSEP